MVKEELYINGENIELLDSLNPNLTFNIADIANPEQRKADFSKTINLPASKKINKIFEHIFDINTDLQSFNPNLKTDVSYLVNGELQLDGYLQLKSIKNKNGLISYDCIIIGRIGNFFNSLEDNELTDLDLSSLNHTYTKANQVATWNLPLTTDYVYPMIDYGINQNILTTYPFWDVEDFFPAVKAKKYIDSIFEEAGFSYTSNFFNSDYFNTLIIPFSSEDFKLTAANIDNKIFSAYNPKFLGTGTVNSSTFSGQYNDITTFQSDIIVNQTESFDANNVYDNTTGIYTVNGNGIYNISAMLQLTGSFTTPTANPTSGTNYFPISVIHGFVRVNKYNSSNSFISTLDEKSFGISPGPGGIAPNTTITTDSNPALNSFQYIDVTLNSPAYVNLLGLLNANPPNQIFINVENITLNDGEKIKIEVLYECRNINQDNINTGYPRSANVFWRDNNNNVYAAANNSFRINIVNSYFNNNVVNSSYQEGDTIDINSTIPVKIKQKDFIMSIVKMFNLYISSDNTNEKNLLIEPRDDFYSNSVIDWSAKIDKSQDIEFKPMGALNNSKYLYTYKKDGDYYNSQYNETWGEVYGQYEHDVNNDFLKDTNKTEVIFSPTPSIGLTYSDKIIPFILKYDSQNGVSRFQSNIRILQWAGLKSSSQTYIHRDSSGDTTRSDYPYCGMYNDPFNPSEDLGFGLTKEIYWANIYNNIITFNNNNLYNKYYKKFIEEITDPNSKIVNAYFYLNSSDIANLSFKKQYYFEGQYFRLNKVENYNPSNPITKCEFLKIKEATVFSRSTQSSNGGVQILAGERTPTFSNGTGVITNGNTGVNTNSSSGRVIVGSNNYVSFSALGANINGDSNKVYSGTSNIIIQGSGNTISSGVKNVQLINSNNQTVTESNLMYINDEIQGSGSFETVSADFIPSENIRTYLVDTQGGDIDAVFEAVYETFNSLPHVGKIWTFKKLHSTHQVIIDASQINATIDGNTTHTLTNNGDSVTMMWDGQQFNII
jgi:hypothetical protein